MSRVLAMWTVCPAPKSTRNATREYGINVPTIGMDCYLGRNARRARIGKQTNPMSRGESEMAVYTAADFAEPIARRVPDCAGNGVVAVDKGWLHSRGWCSCGWQGKQHVMPAVAIHDAHLHSALNRCRPAVPLISRDMGVRALQLSAN